MTTDSISATPDNVATQTKATYVSGPGKLTYVALACAAVGIALCWFPVVGMTHALAAVITGFMSRRNNHCRTPLVAIMAGAVATVASVVFTVIEAHGIEVVNTYSAAPWI